MMRKTYLVPPTWRDKDEIRKAVEGEDRDRGVGGSEAALVLGISKWGSTASLWASKTGAIPAEYTESETHSLPYWGNVMEPVVLREFAMDIKRVVVGRWWDGSVVRYGVDGSVYRINRDPLAHFLHGIKNPEAPFMIGHIDGLVLDQDDEIIGIVDAKTANFFMSREWGEEMTDEVPDDYLCQAMHYLECIRGMLGRAVPAWVALLLGGMTWRLYKIEYHDELAGLIRDSEALFWQSVQSGDMPPIPPTEKGLDLLRRLHPAPTSSAPIDITGQLDWLNLADQLNIEMLREKDLKKRITALKVRFQERMAGYPEVVTGARSYGATWRKNKAKRNTDYGAVLDDLKKSHNLPASDVSAAVANHTTIKPGARKFVFKPSEDDLPDVT